ncbi:hypothetical protein KOR42_19160 [Thalassoglobus neptunius]|uniref:Uncharacterized protein n=1 Tax=Thalassoglobus neptunius TaxID=1938619 RepID=A0A5C5X8R0_9PLAN|nr:hypothetical protein [Thalassoglobus neptunius]TWT58535.1 hypothetical protein KOR42_19160 [Thalassoglobus neptunius]
MFVVYLDAENRVQNVTGLYKWIWGFRGGLEKTRYDDRRLDRLKRIVDQIGEVRTSESALPFAFNSLLVGLEVPDETMLEILNIIRPEWVVVGKLGLESELVLTLEDLRNQSDNPKIQERIDALITGGVIE